MGPYYCLGYNRQGYLAKITTSQNPILLGHIRRLGRASNPKSLIRQEHAEWPSHNHPPELSHEPKMHCFQCFMSSDEISWVLYICFPNYNWLMHIIPCISFDSTRTSYPLVLGYETRSWSILENISFNPRRFSPTQIQLHSNNFITFQITKPNQTLLLDS